MRKEEYWDTVTLMHDRVPHYSLGNFCSGSKITYFWLNKKCDNTPESKVLYTSVVPGIRIPE